jgi:hypothetical protein
VIIKFFFKDCIFHVVVFYWFIFHFSRNVFNWISNLRPNMTYNMIKTQKIIFKDYPHTSWFLFSCFHPLVLL